MFYKKFNKNTHYRVANLCGHDVLFSIDRIDHKTVRENGLNIYDMRYAKNGIDPASIEKCVLLNYFGCIITDKPIKIDDKKLKLKEKDFIYDGAWRKPQDFF